MLFSKVSILLRSPFSVPVLNQDNKFNPPDCFLFDKPADWPEWKQRFLRFRTTTKLDRETPAVQVSSLVYAMGREAEKIYGSFQLATTVPAPATGADARTPKAFTDL